MADNIYHEARGEGLLGWELVRAVTNNRVSDKRWPKTVCVVVHQKWQFSWTNSGKAKILNQTKWLEIINHLDNTVSADFKGANHYHTLTVNPSWNKDMNKLGVVGNHVYYKG
jgi:spore germination cell wall hydrolase CwlJ-like protein